MESVAGPLNGSVGLGGAGAGDAEGEGGDRQSKAH
jgi:hypothetical protein